jgi:transcriptional regulator with XRE-family HTH domain
MSEPKGLRELRQERGLSVEELAEHSGVDVEIIRAIERGRWYQENDLLFAPQKRTRYSVV